MTQPPGPSYGQPPYDAPDGTPGRATRPWFRRKRMLIPAALLTALIGIGIFVPADDEQMAAASSPDATAPPSSDPRVTATPEPPTTAAELAAKSEADRMAAEKAAADEAQEAADDAAKLAADQAAAERAAADQAAAEQAAAEQAAAEQAASEQAASVAKAGTVSQQNAYDSAKNYLEFKAFSRSGLIKQLSSEYGDGFPGADAEFAVSRLEAEKGVDWNEQAAKSAKDYLKFKSFSRSGLIEQLSSEYGEGFTQAQAEYGVSTTGL